ncbi:MAG: VOC family protein [Deltaproteobacteria bacterium]|nr:VOC family protein [Deltaproteobacteria bacterium]
METFLRDNGNISWTELTTNDPEAACQFYTQTFGWQYETMNMAVGTYHVIKNGERAIGGIMKTPEQAQGQPPTWTSYVSVDNVDETAKKIQAAGGKIIVPAMDIPQVGRLIVLQDPQGAMIAAITYAAQS